MQSFLTKFENLRGWNKVPLTDISFDDLCKEFKITVKFLPLSVDGFYSCSRRKHYIAINSRVSAQRALFVMFHEFGHYLMHSPSTENASYYCGSTKQSRDEQEADAFAYCSLLPLASLKDREPEELADMHGMSFLLERLAVYERYRI